MKHAVEGAEDDDEQARHDLEARGFGAKDVLCGIAASGRTPYVIGALRYARQLGAASIAIACNRDSPMEALADIDISVELGPEVISGSTRMKAGSAQKMILNMLSTAVMIRLGKVYGNLMVDVRVSNPEAAAAGYRARATACRCGRIGCAAAAGKRRPRGQDGCGHATPVSGRGGGPRPAG